jgi:hypothetical protein
VCLITKYAVKQVHALLIKIKISADGSVEEANSLNSRENGSKAFAAIKRTENRTVAKSSLKNVFIIIFSLQFYFAA